MTDEGRAASADLGDTAPWERMSGAHAPGGRSLKSAMIKLAAATQLAGRTADESLVEKTVAIVDDARKRIYTLLADD